MRKIAGLVPFLALTAWLSPTVSAQMLPEEPVGRPEGEREEETPMWRAGAELGLVNTSGNTDTTTLNLGAEVVRTTPPWRHRFAAEALQAEEDGVDTADRWVGEWQSDYRLSEKSYVFGALRHDSDAFSGFDYQQTAAVGYGRTLVNDGRQVFEAEIGPGFRRIKGAVTGEVESEAIARALLDYHLDITATTVLDNRLLVESGSRNTLVNNDLALEVAINNRFALAFGVLVRHNTDAPEGTEETDTTTRASVVYSLN